MTALALMSLPAIASAPSGEDGTSTTTAGPLAAGASPESDRVTPAKASAKAPEPRLYLDEPAHGAGAIEALGEHLDEVAAMNAMSAPELRGLLQNDKTLWLGRDGRAFYADPVSEHAESGEGEFAKVPDNAAMATYPESQTFQLHSLPGSAKTIYLDFDGITLGDTYWTDSGFSATPLTQGAYPGFSLDGNPAFSSEEKAYIQTVWRIVAEKYATFDVDVTTEDPGQAAYNRATWADTGYGAHVAITSSPTVAPKLCSGTCAGISLIGTFNDPLSYWNVPVDYLQPSWVFTSGFSSLAPSRAAYLVANVATHEAGHQLGLNHDGVSPSTPYYQGAGNWVPVMGESNFRSVVQFDKGEYTNAAFVWWDGTTSQWRTTVPQDDFAVMAADDTYKPDGNFLVNGGGLPRRADTIANNPGEANNPSAPVLGPISTAAVDGVIESRGDVDVVRVDHRCDGDLTVAANGIGVGATLDIKLDLLDASSGVLASHDPTWTSGDSVEDPVGMDATVTVPALPAGTYYAQVDGVGRGLATGNGYTDYGSVGQYRITTSDCPPPAPTDVLAAQTTTSHGSISWTPAPGAEESVTGYRVSGLPGADITVPAQTTSILVSGLEGGRDYPVSVKSVSVYGVSAPAYAELVTQSWAPETAPGLDVEVAADQAALTWSPPANPGGAVLGDWRLVVTGPDTDIDQSEDLATTSLELDDLAPGAYEVSLTLGTDGGDTPAATSSFTVTGPPTDLTADLVHGDGTLTWSAPADDGASGITGYRITGLPGGERVTEDAIPTLTVEDLPGGERFDLTIVALTAHGESAPYDDSFTVLTWLPSATPTLGATVSGTRARISWEAPANPGNATPTGWRLQIARGPAMVLDQQLSASSRLATPSLPAGDYRVTLTPSYDGTATPAAGTVFSIRTAPSAPRIGKAASGKRGKPVTVRARWKPPADSGNSTITGYVVIAKRVGKAPKGQARKKTISSPLLGASTRSYVIRLPKGKYRLRVVAHNGIGMSPSSAWSGKVTAR